eukprot:15165352-Heterocapsa_arctica.AAC.1
MCAAATGRPEAHDFARESLTGVREVRRGRALKVRGAAHLVTSRGHSAERHGSDHERTLCARPPAEGAH